MIQNKTHKKIFPTVMSVLLIFSMAFANPAEVMAADRSGMDGTDIGVITAGTADADDIGASIMENVPQTVPVQETAFRVMDSQGAEFGTYSDWAALLSAFKAQGNVAEEYTILVSKGAVIGTVMPAKAGRINLEAADAGRLLLFAGSTVNMSSALSIGNVWLCVAGSADDEDDIGTGSGGDREFQGTPVNINTKGKTLALDGTRNIGRLKGSSSGRLDINGDVEVTGLLQTFKYVTVKGSLRLGDSMTSISNLDIENGKIYLASGKQFTVSRVDGGQNGTLVYPDGTMPNVKLGGALTGSLALRREVQGNGAAVESYFTAGSKLLTASKAEAGQFRIFGDRQVCYKKGSIIYAGAEVLQLYDGDTLLGTYAQWGDMVAQIKNMNQGSKTYRAVLLDDFMVNGALTMPAKGRYAGLTVEAGEGRENVLLTATKGVTLTASLGLGGGVRLQVASVSGASRQLAMSGNSALVTTGAVTVADLIMEDGASLQAGGKFTVKKRLEAKGNAELILTRKKGAAIKDTQVGNVAVTVRMRDASDNRVTLAQNTTLFTVSGNSYATQYRLLDSEGQEQPLYRKGKAIKVQGTVATPVTLYYVSESGNVSLGEYTSLADVKQEIARRKDAGATYRIEMREEVFVKGAVPLPGANTYKELIFAGGRICTTGNMTLTGNVTLYNEIRKVKRQGDVAALPYAVNLAKYTLMVPAGSSLDSLGSVKGKAGSCLNIGQGKRLDVDGEVNVGTLVLGGTLRGNGNITLTDLKSEPVSGTAGRAEFRLLAGRQLLVKGAVDIGGQEQFIVNLVDRDDVPAALRAGTVLVTTQYGQVSQFRTENVMPVTLEEWSLVKIGAQIRTSAFHEGNGEWSGDYL